MLDNDQVITLPDGRSLGYTTFGTKISSDQPIIFYFHGFPGTHHEGAPVYEAAVKRGIALVGVTRPGFGDSTLEPGRSISSFAPDVLHLADHIGAKRFAILGISGGGPYALACLRDMPADRLRAVAVVSSMWPTSFSMAGMRLPFRIMHNTTRWTSGLVAWMTGFWLGGPAKDTENPERFEELVAEGFKSWQTVDRDAIFGNGGKVLKGLTESTRQSMKHGTSGIACEAKLFGTPWDFALEDVPVDDGRLELWHGAKDVNVPIGMADEAVKHMPNAKYNRCETEGHLSLIVNHMDEILDSMGRKLAP